MNGLQRFVCLAITGAFKTVPTAGNNTKFCIFAKEMTIIRFSNKSLVLRGNAKCALGTELIKGPVLGMPSDKMETQSFEKRFQDTPKR